MIRCKSLWDPRKVWDGERKLVGPNLYGNSHFQFPSQFHSSFHVEQTGPKFVGAGKVWNGERENLCVPDIFWITRKSFTFTMIASRSSYAATLWSSQSRRSPNISKTSERSRRRWRRRSNPNSVVSVISIKSVSAGERFLCVAACNG